MSDQTFTVGDVVILNSGGPKMTVVEVQQSQVRAAWIDDHDELETAWFPNACVFLVHGESGAGVA